VTSFSGYPLFIHFYSEKKTLRESNQCLHLGRYWKKTWENYKNTFQFCSTPNALYESNSDEANLDYLSLRLP